MHRGHCFFTFVWFITTECCCVKTAQFFASSPLCHSEPKDPTRCYERFLSGGDKTVCFLQCRADDTCVGVSQDASDREYCFLHYACPGKKVCGVNDVHARYYSKNCAHGGRWIPSENKCHCVNGWVGTTCQDLPRDFTDLMESGYKQGYHRTYYDLQSQGRGLIPVYVFFDSSTMYGLVKILHHTGDTNFNMSLIDFRKGFFNGENNNWAGLDVWSTLSQAGYTKLFAVMGFKTTGQVYRVYRDFMLSGASGGFRIRTGSGQSFGDGPVASRVNFGDCFGPHEGYPFSTFDRDVDGNPAENCAAKMGSGWWYGGNCTKACNVFGWGPSHWSSIPAGQKLSVPGMPESFITQDEWSAVWIYIKR